MKIGKLFEEICEFSKLKDAERQEVEKLFLELIDLYSIQIIETSNPEQKIKRDNKSSLGETVGQFLKDRGISSSNASEILDRASKLALKDIVVSYKARLPLGEYNRILSYLI